jgi:phosphopantetheinyl transferase
VAARWALRLTLARYTGVDPVELPLEIDDRGKPRLATRTAVRFNLSHSAGLALIAITTMREVGIDVERTRPERPDAYYRDWVRREAVAKCSGSGLGGPLPDEALWVSDLDPGPGWTAALALRGEDELPQRLFELDPAR